MTNWIMLRFGPRCAAEPPWRLADAEPCIRWRGHVNDNFEGADWHADGTGFIWNIDRWAWRGPAINLEDEYP